jgi:hypothetical protein
MPLYGRAIMGALALFVAWTLVRAMTSGTVFSQGRAYSFDDSPMMATALVATHGVLVVYCLWLAAGYDTASFLHLLGLDALIPWLPAPRHA